VNTIETLARHKRAARLAKLPIALAIFFLLITWLLARVSAPFAQSAAPDEFFVDPYLQLGNNNRPDQLELLWVANRNYDKWRVEIENATMDKWRVEQAPITSIVLTPHRAFLYQCRLKGLTPGETFQYRIMKNDKEAFHARALAGKKSGQSYRVVLFGDMGANTQGQRKVAFQISQAKPDLTVLLGDIVYDFGLYSEYLDKFFPIYNCSTASPEGGIPLLRSVPTVAVLGNHDVALGDNPQGVNLDKFPDGLAFFDVWSLPLNGPKSDGQTTNVPRLLGTKARTDEYLKAAHDQYPRMANYSFDYGDAHWLVLDANPYMNWTDAALRSWVSKDLANAKAAKWKFVCFHQPGFSLDVKHSKEQRMRLLSDLFEKGGVDLVFSGHAHNYQRSFPLRFKAKEEKGRPAINPDGTVDGDCTLDKHFDGGAVTVPEGIIYLVSGGGGASLYPSAETKDPTAKRVFTDKFISNTHSFTVLDVSVSSLKVSQISEDGAVLDSFIVSHGIVAKTAPLPSSEKSPARSASGKTAHY
jgi:predicted phosphodiesterase